MSVRIEIRSAHAASQSSPGEAIVRSAPALGISTLRDCHIVRLYFLAHDPGEDALQHLCAFLLADPVLEQAKWGAIDQAPARSSSPVIEVAYRPGVTDVAARELARGMVEIGLPACEVATGTRYELSGDLSEDDLRRLARGLLCNTTVQHFSLGPIAVHFDQDAAAADRVETVPLANLASDELLALSKRRLLSLDLTEMRTIQHFYAELGRDPTDVELETLAQTWSEHCVHKTFKAQIDFTWLDAAGNVRQQETIDGLIYQYLAAQRTSCIPTGCTRPLWTMPVSSPSTTTMTSPSRSRRTTTPRRWNPLAAPTRAWAAWCATSSASRPARSPTPTCSALARRTTPTTACPTASSTRSALPDGVVAGVGDYGNKLGIPTVNGAVVYDEGYLGNPLVFCGCAGLLPIGKHPRAAQAGDLVVALGGRTGRDGIHGATFSSAELTHETSETTGSAVQIGDPITEKGLIELIEAARDRGLYTAITDCGAGGFSSAVGEMGEKLGVDVDLANAPLKYPGLAPWEIWISEAQERMVLAVPPANLPELQSLADLWDVELSVLGTFTGDGTLRVRFDQRIVAELPMAFLHDGLPRRRMQAV